MNEKWIDIKGYEGIYQISNLGHVRNNKKLMTPTDNGNGYLIVKLQHNGAKKNYYVHRLVAIHFIKNPNNLRCVNHKDYDKYNNYVENLEWVSQKENVLYSAHKMKHKKLVTHSNTQQKYITYRKTKQVYRVIINQHEYGAYKTLNEAIQKRNSILGVV